MDCIFMLRQIIEPAEEDVVWLAYIQVDLVTCVRASLQVYRVECPLMGVLVLLQ